MANELITRARAWLAEDPDPETRAELAALISEAESEERPADVPGGAPDVPGGAPATAELAARFSGTLQFGTAGLRGEMGAGPMRMNRTVVIRAAAGLAAYLRAQARNAEGAAAGPGLVVIGYDARHRSADFARDTAAVVTGAGLRAALLPRPLPTPVLAFAIRHLGAVAGVAVTASHNPPQDNGYKVYLGDGSQIVPPADAAIADEIAAVGAPADVPRPAAGWEVLGEEIVAAYLARTAAALAPGSPRAATAVYTPLHGVGQSVLTAAFAGAGFPAPVEVPEQAAPDPDFPTVAFPNPEEPGAMDLALARARATVPRPDLLIANDPDADRCAVGIPDPGADGGWRMLRGDELGALLAHHLVRRGVRGTFATSIVSSSLTGRIAEAAGLPFRETLTGFKWLARVPGLGFAYEEALGYCVDPAGVRDKDGITAALCAAELAAGLKAEGRTPADVLDELALAHGLHATDQLSVRVPDLSLIAGAMRRLRARPPRELAGLAVTRAEDLAEGAGELPPTDGLRYTLGGGGEVSAARVIVRPSGTEPKLKAYVEVVLPVSAREDLPGARAAAAAVLRRVSEDLRDALGLVPPVG
ncbi:phospho-sugar mutase [Streptomyces sp. MP131-18]|uniref:phospho-sugar mutase n=1 Tax=Streptomyces sp. MP131-18 TaxID=1857892 RepID=UPI00097BF5CE|nr:phospho-sugar mutase [Streptomyces sp. MP131-18]ONK11890.1 putative phosphomannomutase [Streptomyces sp. MP131-18]